MHLPGNNIGRPPSPSTTPNPQETPMAPTVFFPYLTPGRLPANVLMLCDLFQITDKSQVPVSHFTICAGGTETKFSVGPGQYETALVLFHLMAGSPDNAPGFWLTRVMQEEVVRSFYDPVTLSETALPGSNAAMRNTLLQKTVWVELELRPGYEKHLAAFRTPEEVLRYNWERREDIQKGAPEPFLRRALDWFFELEERKELDEIPNGNELSEMVLPLFELLNRPVRS